MGIQFIDLRAQQERIRERIDNRVKNVLDHGKYIMGPEVAEFEAGLSDFCGASHAIGCANGTDALHLALLALDTGPGDAVFCPSFTFAATAEVVPHVDGTPIFVDVCPDTFNLDVESLKRAIVHARESGLKPKGIVPVDLFGLPADYDAIEAIANENGMWTIADSAQGFGSSYKGKHAGSIGTIATTSFFPAKPLGCYGDGGALFTSDDELAEKLRSLRVHGKGTDKYDNVRIGVNSRLDTLQAAILLEKLAIYPEEIELRQAVASRYTEALADVIQVPTVPDGLKSVWAQYTLKSNSEADRQNIMSKLREADIPSVVYYPMPLHLQSAYSHYPSDPAGLGTCANLSKTVFSIPMHPYLDMDEQSQIVEVIRNAIRQL